MRASVLVVLLCWPCLGVQAYTNFVQNPYTPYPPACDWTFGWSEFAWYNTGGDSKRYQFHQGEVSLQSASAQGGQITAKVTAYRVACPEQNRSQIVLQFTSPDNQDGYYDVPSVRAVLDGNRKVTMSLSETQDTWNLEDWPASQHGYFGMLNCAGNNGLCSQVGWTFVLDNKSPLIPGVQASEFITAEEYNDSFSLEINWSSHSAGYVIHVPATAQDLYEAADVPLSGRHSGLWVIEDASDQGFNIAVSESVAGGRQWMYESPYVPYSVLFLSWYTFDAEGQPLWLVGNTEFRYGESEISLELVAVTGGEFLGDKASERMVVGQAKIKANNCNDLGFEYDLNSIGLGAGVTHLQRLFSLEIAGHACRDMGARVADKR